MCSKCIPPRLSRQDQRAPQTAEAECGHRRHHPGGRGLILVTGGMHKIIVTTVSGFNCERHRGEGHEGENPVSTRRAGFRRPRCGRGRGRAGV